MRIENDSRAKQACAPYSPEAFNWRDCMAEHGYPDAHPDDNPDLPDDDEEEATDASAPIAGTGP